MNKFLKLSIPSIIIGGLLVGCGNTETSETAETKEKAQSNPVATEEVTSKQEKEEYLPYETSENFGEWITKANMILEEDPKDPKWEESNYDEEFGYYLKMEEIFDLKSDMEAWAEGKAMGEDMKNLFTLKSGISLLHFSRTSHLGESGQAVEKAELAEQWLPPTNELKETYEYAKQLLHDLDVAVNHDGGGETYGVTHTLNGDKVQEMTRTWSGGSDMDSSNLEIGMFTYGEDGVSAYDSLESFINDLSDNWAHDSQFRENQMDYSAEMQLVEQSLYDIAYFETEIDEFGMSKLFGDLQQTAFEMVVNDYEDGDTELHIELAAKYENTLSKIIEEANGIFE